MKQKLLDCLKSLEMTVEQKNKFVDAILDIMSGKQHKEQVIKSGETIEIDFIEDIKFNILKV